MLRHGYFSWLIEKARIIGVEQQGLGTCCGPGRMHLRSLHFVVNGEINQRV